MKLTDDEQEALHAFVLDKLYDVICAGGGDGDSLSATADEIVDHIMETL